MASIRRFAFLHVPKSAGTSFTNALSAIRSVSPPFDPNYRIQEDLARQLDRYDIVASHLSYDDYERWFSDRLTFTVLRDPIERCLSWYWYCRNVVPASVVTPEVSTARVLNPEDYFKQDRSIIFRVSMNGQCRQLGGHLNICGEHDRALLERAKSNLERMAWIGFSETLESDVERLRILPEFSNLPSLFELNRAKRDSPVSESVQQIIAENNRFDIELYEFAKGLNQRAIGVTCERH